MKTFKKKEFKKQAKMAREMARGKPVDCRRCKHLVITWNRVYPRACKAMGFQSRNMPSQEVLSVTGHGCLMFEPKPQKLDQASAGKAQGRRGLDGRRHWHA